MPVSFNDLDDSEKMVLEQKLEEQLNNLSLNKINKRSSSSLDRYTPPFLTDDSRSLTNIVIHITWLLYCDGIDSPTPKQVFEKLKVLAEECESGQNNGYFKPLNRDEITKIIGPEVVKNEIIINWQASDASIVRYTFAACKKTVNEWKKKMRASNWISFDS